MKKLIIKGMGARYFSNKIVKWYLENRRPLPWRDTSDPYKIWLSEVILQQTRVAQGLPYYHRFVSAFPTVHNLADASEQQILRLWQGLGYYTRARNLHKCAKAVVQLHQGRFPSSSHALQELPGIGHYTAAAIASFAFNEKIAVLDGNVFRVLSRVFGIDTPINTPEGHKRFNKLANELICHNQPAVHNQAIMEFGATWCTPLAPRCDECPLRQSCQAFDRGLVSTLPLKTAGKKPRNRYFYYLVIQLGDSLLMKKRTEKDIWQGLFDFVLIEKDRPTRAERLVEDSELRNWFKNTEDVRVSEKFVHTLTHQKIHCRFVHATARPGYKSPDDAVSFYSTKQMADLPMPVLITRYLSSQVTPCLQKIGSFDPV